MRQRSLLVALAVLGCLLLGACVRKTEYDALQRKLNDTTKELSETKDSLKNSQDRLNAALSSQGAERPPLKRKAAAKAAKKRAPIKKATKKTAAKKKVPAPVQAATQPAVQVPMPAPPKV